MAAFLVTGNPGSGKTMLAQELSRRGLTAMDADYVPRLCHYEDDAGNTYSRAEAPLEPNEQWLSTHRWVWDRSRLKEVLREQPAPVFMCGIARNITEVIDLFQCIFLLRINADTQEERLLAHDLSSPEPRNAAGRQQIRAGRPFFEAEMLELGAIAIDANAPTAAVADAIVQLVSRYARCTGDATGCWSPT